jgi:hypothetical protein
MEQTEADRGALFTDSGSGASLLVRTTSWEPSASAEQRLEEARVQVAPAQNPPLSARATDTGFMVTGTDDQGRIYYWRQVGGPSGGVDLIWYYPSATRGTFDPAVQRSVDSLKISDGS